MYTKSWFLWIVFSIILLIIEIVTPEFIVAGFALGGLAAALTAYFAENISYQLLVFSITTILFLWKVRPFFLKYLDNKNENAKTNVYNLIGKKARVSETIGPDEKKGRILIGSDDWMAMSVSGKKIKKGVKVKILKVEGATLIVEKIN
ncbi:MAG: NfeD family protein [Halanaerobiales bacterium]